MSYHESDISKFRSPSPVRDSYILYWFMLIWFYINNQHHLKINEKKQYILWDNLRYCKQMPSLFWVFWLSFEEFVIIFLQHPCDMMKKEKWPVWTVYLSFSKYPFYGCSKGTAVCEVNIDKVRMKRNTNLNSYKEKTLI